MPRLLVSLSFIITVSQDAHKHGFLHRLSCSSDEFPESLRGSIRQDHEGRFYEDFYRSVPGVVHCFLLSTRTLEPTWGAGRMAEAFCRLWTVLSSGLWLRTRDVMSGRHCWSLSRSFSFSILSWCDWKKQVAQDSTCCSDQWSCISGNLKKKFLFVFFHFYRRWFSGRDKLNRSPRKLPGGH